MPTRLLAFVALSGLVGCAHATSSASPQQLLEADARFAADVQARGVDAWVEAFAEDGAMLPGGGARIQGRAAIREAMQRLGDPRKAPPVLRIEWWPKLADISADGTLGYTVGNSIAHGPKGDQKGKYVTIWKKQADGSWKAVLDLGNPGWAVP